MQIIEATIHRLKKDAHTTGEDAVEEQLRDDPLPINDTLTTVCDDLRKLYHRSTDSSGIFGDDPTTHVFPVKFEEYLRGEKGFMEFTRQAMALIKSSMAMASLANGGYALFVRYRVDSSEFLMIAMLKLKAGAGINQKDLGLFDTLSIDLSLLSEAARINITRHQADEEPYLTFIRGGRQRAAVTEYFRHALSCLNYTNAEKQTKALIDAAEDFIEQRPDLQSDHARKMARIEMRKSLHDCLSNGTEEVTLMTIAGAIHPEAPQEFIDFAQTEVSGERKYAFSERFKPDRAVVRNLKRIQAKMGTVSVSFQVSDVVAGKVGYDEESGAVVIHDPTPELIKEIQEYESSPAN